MDKNRIIDKAHKELLASLTDEESVIFGELTPEHQLFIVGWLVYLDEREFPEDESIETTIRTDIDDCIKHVKSNIKRINGSIEGREEWELWRSLKSRVIEKMDIRELARLLFAPYDIKAGNDNRLTLQDTAANIMAGFWVTEGYIEPYLYPWQTAMKNILFKTRKLPSVWTPQERRMFYGELPLNERVYAVIHINGMEAGTRAMPLLGRMHPAKMLPVWKSYLHKNQDTPAPEPPSPQKKGAYTLEKEQERRAIYRKVVDEMGVSTKKSVLDEEAAKRAGCTARMIREALRAEK